MIAAGVNVKALTTFMGHASVAFTLDRYGHLSPVTRAKRAGCSTPTSTRLAARVPRRLARTSGPHPGRFGSTRKRRAGPHALHLNADRGSREVGIECASRCTSRNVSRSRSGIQWAISRLVTPTVRLTHLCISVTFGARVRFNS